MRCLLPGAVEVFIIPPAAADHRALDLLHSKRAAGKRACSTMSQVYFGLRAAATMPSYCNYGKLIISAFWTAADRAASEQRMCDWHTCMQYDWRQSNTRMRSRTTLRGCCRCRVGGVWDGPLFANHRALRWCCTGSDQIRPL